MELKPIFRYIGGKTWMSDFLRKSVAKMCKENDFKAYCEPFVGGLGAFIAIHDLLLSNGIKRVYLNDLNKTIISFYTVVFNNPVGLINEVMKIEDLFSLLVSKKSLEDARGFYLEQRNLFNTKKLSAVKKSALLVFLQNHCFNGIYRENLSGGYNSPFNWSKRIFDKDQIKEKIMLVNKLFKSFDICFSSISFEKLDMDQSTLYYLDPPYFNKIGNENKYNKLFFDLKKQKELINLISDKKFIYSNHYESEIINEFKLFPYKYKFNKIKRKNIMSSKVSSRKDIKVEVLITS